MTKATLADIEQGGFDHAVLAFVEDDGYPMEMAAEFRLDTAAGAVRLDAPATGAAPPEGAVVNVIFSHIRPQQHVGYDERRYVSLWGRARRDDGGLVVTAEKVWGWDENKLPFLEYSERSVPQSRRYFDDLGRLQGREVRPRLAGFSLFLRTTRLPFITATAVPVALGVAAAARGGEFDLWLALLTLLGAIFIHLALNVTNDIFDTLSGADAANMTPTKFSGGSRVIHYGLVSERNMALLAAAFYLAGGAIGVYLAATRGWQLLVIGLIGMFFAVFYTAPPLRLVYRGLGEIAVALGFGPVMLLGSFFVQAQTITLEAVVLSIPVAILIALVLYVNEVPDRPGDALAEKRTLPVRWTQQGVIRGYLVAAGVAFAVIAVASVIGLFPRPALIALATVPMAVRVARGMRENYDSPYALMPTMALNINLHLYTGLLLLAGYLIVIIAGAVLDPVPALLP
jgi:1,4-dihydroxy-2-naphthoate octaprenyltransferase